MSKKKILILTSGYGHASMAEAVKQAIKRPGLSIKVKKFNGDDNGGFTPFGIIYRFAPFLFKYVYRFGRSERQRRVFDSLMDLVGNREEMQKYVQQYKPDLIISTHYAYDRVLAQMGAGCDFGYFNLVHEAWADHPILYSKTADVNLVYDHKAAVIAHRNGAKKVAEIGWLVRPQFYNYDPKPQEWLRLGFSPKVATILLVAGTDGDNTVLKILPALMAVKRPLQVVVITGRNDSLYFLLTSLGGLLGTKVAVWESKIKIKVLRYVKDIHKYMGLANLVVGRAGPQTVFESVAMGKPFLVLTHMGGYQDNVLGVISKKQLGVVEERASKVGKVFQRWLEKPESWEKYYMGVQKERINNKEAAKRLVRVVEDYLRQPKKSPARVQTTKRLSRKTEKWVE